MGPAALFAALAAGDYSTARNGKDWTRTLWGGAPPMAAHNLQHNGLGFFADPIGHIFGFG